MPKAMVMWWWAQCKEGEKPENKAHKRAVISACIRKYYDDLTVRETEAITTCLQERGGSRCLPFDSKRHNAETASASTECVLDGLHPLE
jgi:hypothetical protein